MEEKQSNGTIKKLLLGVIIGGAVGSVVGATLSKKEIRDKVRSQILESSNTLKEIIESHDEQSQKKGFWHVLNKLLVRKNKEN